MKYDNWRKMKLSKELSIIIFSFIILCILIFFDEVVDIPHFILGMPLSIINWTEIIIELFFVFCVFFITIFLLQKVVLNRKRTEEKIVHLNSAHRVIHKVNQLIVQEKDPKTLIKKICKNFVEAKDYSSVWIALLDDSGKVNYLAEEGLDKDILKSGERFLYDYVPRCFKKALETDDVVLFKDVELDCKDCPMFKLHKGSEWRIRSMGLRSDGKCYGVINISSPANYIADIEEQSLLKEVARDIAYTLHNMELEEKHKKSKVLLNRSYENFQNIIKNDIVGIIITDKEGIMQFINTEAEILFNRKAEDLLGTLLGLPMMTDDFTEISIITNDGKHGTGEVRIAETEWEGEFANLIMINDITERKKSEKDLKQALEKAEESDRLKSSFLSNMSHEIRTPLNAIVGFSDMLGDDIPDEEKERFVPIIKENSNQLLHLIDDILDLSKIESDQLKIFKKECRVVEVLESLVDVFNNQKTGMEGKEIDIRLKTEKQIDELSIYTDPVRLQQVLSNLIGNALKFTESGYIEIGCSVQTKKDGKNDRFIQFYVKDTGIGISEKEQKIIFDRFIKVEGDITKLYRGTGLGLAISKKLVNILGGEIWVESTTGKGSTFYFFIPAGEVEMSKTKTGPAKKVQETNGSDNWDDKSILVAEDEESNFKLIEIILQKKKANISWVTNGEDAVEACKSKSFDLVLMDIKMPVMDGFTATKMIKKIKKELPVIAVTAYAREEEKEECFLAGCDDIVVKPINIKELLTTLSKYI